MAGEHKNLGKDIEKYHNKGKRGACVSGHESNYRKGMWCSYRWQAAVGACKYPDIYGAKSPDEFSSSSHPWGNQVHHIIPGNVLYGLLVEVCEKEGEVIQQAVEWLLVEQYNINDERTVIVLPTTLSRAWETGLPRHFGSHQKFDEQIETHLKAKLSGKYAAIVRAVKKKKHGKEQKAPNVKAVLMNTAAAVYKQLIAEARAKTRFELRKKDFKIHKVNLLFK